MKNEDYKYEKVWTLYEKITNDSSLDDKTWLERKLYLRSLNSHMAYSEAQLKIFKDIPLSELNSLMTPNHKEYTDKLYRYLSSSIAFYNFAYTSISFLKKLTNTTFQEYDSFIKDINLKRHRLAAHPNEINDRKGVTDNWSSLHDDGRIYYRIIDIEDIKSSFKIEASPLHDFVKLKELVNAVIDKLKMEWKL